LRRAAKERHAIKPLNILALIATLLIVAFLIVNWSTLGAPIPVSFGFTHTSVPLGALLLGCTLLLAAVFSAWIMRVQFRHLALHSQHAAELRSQRELVSNAEVSRFTELRQYLEQELAALKQAQRESEQRLRDEMQNTVNTLSACVGELDDRLERQFPSPPERQP
jgi:uncharacterized protein YlxW (UPF0749 family)